MKRLLFVLAAIALQFTCAYVYATNADDGEDRALAGWAWLSGASQP
jgi:hypothetical protein